MRKRKAKPTPKQTQPVQFKSTVNANKRMYNDFAKVNHYSNNFLSLFFMIFTACLCAMDLIMKSNDNLFSIAIFSWILTILYALLAIFVTSLSYKRIKVASGGKDVVNTTTFTDKITVESTSGAKVEYDYKQIRAVLETKKYYYLKMQHNVHMIISKEVNKNGNFTEFLFSKCENIKKKRIRNVNNAKAISFVYIAITTVLVLLTTFLRFA